jgi:phosphonate transport system ATP-binding protein
VTGPAVFARTAPRCFARSARPDSSFESGAPHDYEASSPVLSLENLHVRHASGRQALSDLSLQLRPGELTVFLGRSGAGKSTLLRCLNGLVVPSAGRVLRAGAGSLRDRRVLREHRRQTGTVFQQHHLMGRLSAYRNVLVGRLAQHGPIRSLFPLPRRDGAAALACLDRVMLLDRAFSRVDQLSGGEQQRVGIARALAQQPSLILADEPVASLDPASAVTILELFRSICRQDGITTIMSLHQLDLARRFADRIIGLHAGVQVFDGPPDALASSALARIYGADNPKGPS